MRSKPVPKFELALTAATGSDLLPYLRLHLVAAHTLIAPALAELSVALVGDKKMSDLHLRFLKIPGPTDVLTFPLEHDRRGRVIAGEVVVCVPEARRRCRQHETELKKEVLLYVVHGMLHLCGFDDRTPREFGRMHRTEDRVLISLGVGPVFKSRRPAPPSGDR